MSFKEETLGVTTLWMLKSLIIKETFKNKKI